MGHPVAMASQASDLFPYWSSDTFQPRFCHLQTHSTVKLVILDIAQHGGQL